ncbi:amino acid ABC transporter permease [Mesorhizobium sp. Cs1299R1N1]|uniref:amino acid ABC transporter permease n=1 Tax=Mesorhizobium sp. Cs1299R1N1 TaxID=3015172 RepID=UPI00301BA3B2
MKEDDLHYLIAGLPYTLSLTATGFALGCLLAFPIVAAMRSGPGLFSRILQGYILIVRGTPALVWLFIVFFSLGNGPFELEPFTAAAITFGAISGAYLAEIYRGALSGVPSGQWDAAEALGLDRYSLYKDVVGPQALRIALPSAASYFIGLLKDTAIASTIGVVELTFRAYHVSQMTFNGLRVYAVVALIYICISLPIAFYSRFADAKLRRRISH